MCTESRTDQETKAAFGGLFALEAGAEARHTKC